MVPDILALFVTDALQDEPSSVTKEDYLSYTDLHILFGMDAFAETSEDTKKPPRVHNGPKAAFFSPPLFYPKRSPARVPPLIFSIHQQESIEVLTSLCFLVFKP